MITKKNKMIIEVERKVSRFWGWVILLLLINKVSKYWTPTKHVSYEVTSLSFKNAFKGHIILCYIISSLIYESTLMRFAIRFLPLIIIWIINVKGVSLLTKSWILNKLLITVILRSNVFPIKFLRLFEKT
jgi:hypothetical protein